MAKCNSDSKMQTELKRLFEGECCALSYNDDDDWFDDEDEEFQFDPNGSNKWFEDALEQGLKEKEDMQRVPDHVDDDDEKDDDDDEKKKL
jgi:hypothetical protein